MLVLCHLTIDSQAQQGKKVSLRDSLDGKLDLSDFIIDAHGFVPVPTIITEPALGGFGGALAAVILKKRPPQVKKDGSLQMTQPDITAAVAGYTANGSWFVGGAQVGTWMRQKIKYRFIAAYADMNLVFYRNFENIGEREFHFNFEMLPIHLQGIRQIGESKWYVGLQYTFLKTKVGMELQRDSLPEFVKPIEAENITSLLGATIEYDSRDNIFTPNKGLKAHVHYNLASEIWGSDLDFSRLNGFLFWYLQPRQNWVSGLRVDMEKAFGDPPFYFLPFVMLRGVPAIRYQGETTVVTELEQRLDFNRRWSAVLFGGFGKAFNASGKSGDSPLVWSYGSGFRYLVARKFKVRMGVDVARGPENWAYYIVFGSNWIK
ncbi:BamA/TamA family outer membrane protein [Flavihumibacter rivuli]|uniref:BamA/TamA family outer membrane protein n=1 Tax=Flavihumibacter rivuli TaxID=2838156 RepID=UPI001EFB3E23|nr:BamA/TamA family outer membrane protein [Flavihumibacter rivuli]ULQ55568.1 BamA/TamA family outer membrane protein [Flavihumibacter rivuli]